MSQPTLIISRGKAQHNTNGAYLTVKPNDELSTLGRYLTESPGSAPKVLGTGYVGKLLSLWQ